MMMYGETFYGRNMAQHQLQWRKNKFWMNKSTENSEFSMTWLDYYLGYTLTVIF